MKKILITSLCAMVAGMLCAADQTAPADKGQKAKPTAEQKQERKALIDKYDLNKDGKLDKDEIAKMTQEDKDKWQQLKQNAAGQSKGKKKGGGAKNTQ
ncbi:MAG TPA: hypothetical protein PLW02_11970 [Verrucomicrobiota bacterium]|nr:hypothetical protein [Verrucomicrobiota bacterium]